MTSARSTGAGSHTSAVMPRAYAEVSVPQAEAAAASGSRAARAPYPARWHTPARDDTASKSRPMPEVATQAGPRVNCRSRRLISSGAQAVTPGRSASHGRPAAHSRASARRHGSATPESPPGSGAGARWAKRRWPA
ncbi:hypothetical protein GCM10010266_21070 [Streptomyces griseomycini]|nr:hypothetical protein GCM10010266_21070 [Streptomyces griseomycini]